MSDLYEILGVNKGATEDEIRRAFKKAAAKAHPDRDGGDHNTAVAVNDAYGVLRDAKRRAYYDSTGKTDDPEVARKNRIYGEVMSTFLALAEQAPENADPIVSMHGLCRQVIAQANDEIINCRRMIAKLDRMKKRILRTKPGDNIFVIALETQISEKKKGIERAEEVIADKKLIQEILREYRFEMEEEGFISSGMVTFSKFT